MQQIRFVVPERGSTRFAFQVQGNGTIAAIFRFLFGGLDITSKYYKLADASVCVIRSLPARVVDYLISFINSGDITFFRFLSQSIWWCRSCIAFVIDSWCLKLVVKEQRSDGRNESNGSIKLRILIRTVRAAERLPNIDLDNNRLLVAFYSRKRWFHHRYVPEIVQSLVTYFLSNRLLINPSLSCQICSRFFVQGVVLVITRLFEAMEKLFVFKIWNKLRHCGASFYNVF